MPTTPFPRIVHSPTRPPAVLAVLRFRPGPARFLALIALILAVLSAGLGLSPGKAMAIEVSGRAHGYLDTGAGFWLGSWRLADGGTAFCINAGKATPNDTQVEYTDGNALGWFSPDDAARLAYISRNWAPSQDAATAAAAQIATWTVAGLGAHTIDELAGHAGPASAAVRARALEMTAETNERASRSVAATLSLGATAPAGNGALTVSSTLIVDTLGGGSAPLAPGLHGGQLVLHGAHFADGRSEAVVTNGQDYEVFADQSAALSDISATVSYEGLPYGDAITIAKNTGDAQNLLVARPASALASASVSTTVPSGRPFQPAVDTVTSDTVAEPGASIFDRIVLSAAARPAPDGSAIPGEWGVYGPPDGPFSPVPVTVRSRLLGPFDSEPVLDDEVPDAAPIVCTVEVTITTGPGDYTTPSCTVPTPGYYVWVETISPEDTAVELGRDQLLPWASRFGTASEITRVPAPVPPTPMPSASAGATTATELAETGGSPGVAFLAPVTATLLGAGSLLVWMRRWRRR